ncbi:hypothetical protein [Aquisphaera insulae]|uniref:hypothetical protein n=1 Tax=Aquisphaera insulae TaxID=2712864 RepID=UPI0013EB2D33|nr:hypothetical protein [Aquisphaera insulae]
MMTPSRVVRSLGILGLIAWFGMVGWVAKSSKAQNSGTIDEPPKPAPVDAQAPPAATPTAVAAPIAPVGGLDDLNSPPPLPAVSPADAMLEQNAAPVPPPYPPGPADRAIKTAAAAAPAGSAVKPAATAPAVSAAKPAATAAPAPVGSAASSPAASPAPMPIGPASAVPTTSPIPVARAGAPKGSDDPESSARSFVERNAREAEEHLRALTAEAEELRGRLEKLESGIKQWEGVLRALKGSRHSRDGSATGESARSGSDEPSMLEPIPGRVAARPDARRNRWISSEAVPSPDGAKPTAAVSSEADPSPYLPPASPAGPAAPASVPPVVSSPGVFTAPR